MINKLRIVELRVDERGMVKDGIRRAEYQESPLIREQLREL
jgi:hypothetical protein